MVVLFSHCLHLLQNTVVVEEGRNKYFRGLTYDEKQEKTVQHQLHFGHSD